MTTNRRKPWWEKRRSRKNFLVADEPGLLATVERKARAELQQKRLDAGDQRLLQISLACIFGQLEELEHVGVLRRLERLVGVDPLQRRGEVRQR